MTDKTEQDRVLIFDTTLRDGEQSPGATMTHAEKLEIAALLDEMGVDIIEAGFPIASEGDFEAVKAIAQQSQNAVICGLARAQLPDIDRCWEAVRHAKRPRIHTFIGTSPLHRAIPNLSQDEMAERIHQTVTHARNLCDNVQWSPMDATRTEWEYLCRAGSEAVRYAPLEKVAWYSGNTDDMVTMPVGLKQPNAWGLYDMLGNVFEWVWSQWDASTSGFHDTKLEFTKEAEMVPLRGGSTFYSADDSRNAARVNCDTFYKYGDMGFRVVRNA